MTLNRAQRRALTKTTPTLRLFRLDITPDEAAIMEEALDAYRRDIEANGGAEAGGDDSGYAIAGRIQRALNTAMSGRVRLPQARVDGKTQRRVAEQHGIPAVEDLTERADGSV